MNHDNNRNGPIQGDQLTEIIRGPFILRYLSYRKNEDAALDLRSEDYIVSEITPEKTVFGLCDGVGSSFYGNIGSQILGEILLSWLGKVSVPNNFDPENRQASNNWSDKLTTDLTTELNNRTAFATSIIQKKELASTNEMVRLAETTQRDDFGTQSNFAGGIVWSPSPSLPRGLVLLFWLGNARIRLFGQNGDLTSLLDWGKDPDQLLEVWSSKDGVLGRIYSYVTDLSTVTSIIAYSDGLENAEEQIHPSLNGKQLELLVQYSQSIKDDDATFLELSANNKEVAGQADDMAIPLRRHMQTAPTYTDPNVEKLRSSLNTLQKKYDAQTQKSNSSRGIFIVVALFFIVFCFFLGLFLGPKIIQIITPATQTATPTLTTTPTPTPSAIPTETLTITSTFTLPSPTETVTASPTATSTIAIPTDTPVQTQTTLTPGL